MPGEVILRRKMSRTLQEWRDAPGKKKCLVIGGARQIGKTFVVDEFSKGYRNYLKINLDTQPEEHGIFKGNISAADIYDKLATWHPEFRIEKGRSLLFLDEIQSCEEARSAIKPLVHDGTLDIICSGSLLGVMGLHHQEKASVSMDWKTDVMIEDGAMGEDGTIITTVRSEEADEVMRESLERGRRRLSPLGSERFVQMHPLDFEEYLWARGFSEEQTGSIRKHIADRDPFSESTLEALNKYLRQYILVGGMPDAVIRSLDPLTASEVQGYHADLLRGYRDDVMSYAPDAIKLRTARCLDSIPKQLGRRRTKFRYVDVEGKTGASLREFASPLEWLESAGMAEICENLTDPVLPLSERTGHGFKVYLCDTGLLMGAKDRGTRIAVSSGDAKANLGGIFENTVANMMTRCGFPLFYFERDKVKENGERTRIEIDFMADFDGTLAAIEVKSGRNRRSASLAKLSDDENYSIYGVGRRIKLEEGNIRTDEDGIEHYPLFAAAFMDSMYEQVRIDLDNGVPKDL